MISIIICSINNDYLRTVTENISKTIGVEYELLVWENIYEKKGICEVYNLMAEQARFPLLCFLHEDVLFTTDNWGLILAGVFGEHPEIGVAGLAGSAYKSAMFSGWHTNNDRFDYFNYTHRTNGVDHLDRHPVDPQGDVFPVVCVDGVLIACSRQVWRDIRFDEQNLRGFHFYDIDFSVRAARKYGVAVMMNIGLVHITQGGDYGDRWVEAAMNYHTRQDGRLPFYLQGPPEPPQIVEDELLVASLWLDRLKNEKISLRNKLAWIRLQRLMGRGPTLWYPILRFLIFRPFRLDSVQRLIKNIRSSS